MGFQPCKMEGVSCRELIVKMGRRLKEQTVDTKTKQIKWKLVWVKRSTRVLARDPPEGGEENWFHRVSFWPPPWHFGMCVYRNTGMLCAVVVNILCLPDTWKTSLWVYIWLSPLRLASENFCRMLIMLNDLRRSSLKVGGAVLRLRVLSCLFRIMGVIGLVLSGSAARTSLLW